MVLRRWGVILAADTTIKIVATNAVHFRLGDLPMIGALTDSDFADRRIEPDPKRRSPAPGDVWNFHDYAGWRDEVWTLISNFADQAVQEAVVADPPEYVVSDDLGWLEAKILEVHGVSIDAFEAVMHALRSRYRSIRTAHGSRPTDVGSFYRHGLIPMDPARIQQQAWDIFMSPAYPELNEAMIAQAITDVGHEGRSDRVWFECNETELVRRNGHYMLYGSEYLLAISAHIEGRDYRQDLKGIGEPVVFICDVPLSYLHEGAMRSFAGCAVEALFQELLGESDGPSPTRGCGFSIRRRLAPEHIVGHYRPIVGRDSFARNP